MKYRISHEKGFTPLEIGNASLKRFRHFHPHFLSSPTGFTLVELVLAIVIFVIVMVGGMNFFVYGRSDINREGHRRAALELASQRLEEIKAASYNDIEPPKDGVSYYIRYDGASWYVVDYDPKETVDIDNLTGQSIITTVEYIDDTQVMGSGTYDYLKVEARVSWDEKGVTNDVTLTTLIAPGL